MKNTVLTFQQANENGENLKMLSAFDYCRGVFIVDDVVEGI